MRGLVQTDAMVAVCAGVEPEQVVSLRTGHWDSVVGRKVAVALHLNAAALVALAEGTALPPPLEVSGLACFSTPFDDMHVNSYLVWDAVSRQAVAFDSGADSTPMVEFLNKHALSLNAVLLTHTHGDHVFDLDRLCEKTGARPFVNAHEPLQGVEAFEAGAEWTCGALRVESRLTWGHSRGGTTFVIRGLARPVAVVGDALFAGSMGGAKVSYADALRTNQESIFSLPEDCILCPGHGPLTTVGWEKRWNPFFS
jgi:glyoxylase-like metal-dependent hydrolase (beta-lactamase superfamily II)